MLNHNFLNPEDKTELINLIKSNEKFEAIFDDSIILFQKIILNYPNKDAIDCLSSFITEYLFDLDSLLISLFFLEIFGLRAPNYYGTKDDETKYIILPSLTLVRLKEKEFDISKIIGGFLQLDHEGDMGYQLSQLIGYLLLNQFFSFQEFNNILLNILRKEFASYVRIGRFLGILKQYNVMEINNILKTIRFLSSDLKLDVKFISDILIGSDDSISSDNTKCSLIGKVLKLDKPDLKFLQDSTYISDQVIGLARLLTNYFYENKILSNLIIFIFKINASSVLAESFKYMIDNSIISMNRIGFVLNEDLYNRKFGYSKVGALISINFSLYEISKFLFYIINRNYHSLSYENFIDILKGFCNKDYHGFSELDLIQILNFLQEMNPDLLNKFEIKDSKGFIASLKLEN